jgi:hypothetical protein
MAIKEVEGVERILGRRGPVHELYILTIRRYI